MAAYEKSATKLKSLLSNPALNIEHVERTVEDLQQLVADESEVENAIQMGVGSKTVDEDEIQAELAGLIDAEKVVVPAKEQQEDTSQISLLEERLKALSVPDKDNVTEGEEENGDLRRVEEALATSWNSQEVPYVSRDDNFCLYWKLCISFVVQEKGFFFWFAIHSSTTIYIVILYMFYG